MKTQVRRMKRRLSAGSEGLPEEVLAAGFSLSGGKQRPTASSSFQINVDVFGFSFSQREVLLQSLVLHLQEVRQEQLCQGGPGHVLKHQNIIHNCKEKTKTSSESTNTSFFSIHSIILSFHFVCFCFLCKTTWKWKVKRGSLWILLWPVCSTWPWVSVCSRRVFVDVLYSWEEMFRGTGADVDWQKSDWLRWEWVDRFSLAVSEFGFSLLLGPIWHVAWEPSPRAKSFQLKMTGGGKWFNLCKSLLMTLINSIIDFSALSPRLSVLDDLRCSQIDQTSALVQSGKGSTE